MALDTQGLETDIKSFLDQIESMCKEEGSTPEAVKQQFAKKLASAIEKFVKTGKVESGIKLQAGIYTGATTEEGTII